MAKKINHLLYPTIQFKDYCPADRGYLKVLDHKDNINGDHGGNPSKNMGVMMFYKDQIYCNGKLLKEST